MSARSLVQVLSGGVLPHEATGWNALIAVARAELLLGSLAFRLEGAAVPAKVAAIFADARAQADQGHVAALWEAEMARRALAAVDCPVILLKGTAYAAAGLQAGMGRSIGDLDILVPRDRLDEVEAALLRADWEWVKPDPYDDAYYRRWMHELPPLIHKARDRMIDVHHTILPLTARVKPDSGGLIAASIALGNGLRILSREDMIVHAAAHLLADGDLAGGLRNLWDIHCLRAEFGSEAGSSLRLQARADRHGLGSQVARAIRLSDQLYGAGTEWLNSADPLVVRRLLARDGWGREIRPATRLGFYVRSHWLRMPPAMLARHLWAKARR